MNNDNFQITVVGLGYVGLPLAQLLSTKFKTTGFDISEKRITELKDGFDRTNEVLPELLKSPTLSFTNQLKDTEESNIYIITVPTPIDSSNQPDLSPIKSASKSIGGVLKKNDIVIYESTVYPGLTEERCVPILEDVSGLKWKKDFNVGYSPERVNPGDKEHSIDKIIKVVSADSKESLEVVSYIYGQVITAGIHIAPTIKTAEAAKVIENTQRDLNIALMNELSIIFDKMDICTTDVIKAASTKWNFLPFKPGLVGGHCIGVDPYYLTYKAEEIGYHPQVILSGRRINDSMSKFVAESAIKGMIKCDLTPKNSKVLIAGFTFKENVGDIRNTKIVDVYKELKEYDVQVDVYDPVADPEEVENEYGIKLIDKISSEYDCLVLAVSHKCFSQELSLDNCVKILGNKRAPLIDIKSLYSKEQAEQNNLEYFSL